MLKPLIFFILVVFFVNESFAQRDPIDHIMTDSAFMQGKVSRFGKGKLGFRTSVMQTPTIYSLDSVKEYKVGGDIYEALVIGSKREFYKRYINGDVSLYKKGRTYVLKADDQVKAFTKKNFRSVIASAIKCDGAATSLSKLTYSKSALKGIISSSNAGSCNADLIPHRKFGIVAGYNIVTASASPNSAIKFSHTNSAPSIGLFVDLPLSFRRPGSYLTLEASGLSFQPNFYTERPAETSFMVLRINAVNTTANVKFIKKSGRIRPYFKFGALTSFLHIESPTGLLTTKTTGNVVNIGTASPKTWSTSTQFGFNTAAGLEIPVQKRKNLHFEIRYMRSITGATSDLSLQLSNIAATAGINF